jgi:DMSO reductase anchor subunit
MEKEGVAPHLPDVAISKPTTRYTLPQNMPKLHPADERLLNPAHAELPLVFMTVLTQVSLGAFLALFLGQILFGLGFNLPEPTLAMAIMAFVPSAIGLPLSALHLGRPILAMTAMKNWRTSWLSREAIALGAYTGLASVVAGMYFLEIKGFLLLFVMAITLAMGIFGIYEEVMFYRHLDKEGSLYYQLNRTRQLLQDTFGKVKKLRLYSLIISALLLPLLAILFTASGLNSLSIMVLVLALIGSLLSELAGRYLFYRTVVPLGLAGNFFAGNQRG